jgi:methionyl-tRNA formyltransferase
MKILILANKDIASNLALNYLFQSIGSQHQFQLLMSSSVGKNSQSKPKKLLDLAFFEQTLFNQILFPALQKNLHLLPVNFSVLVGLTLLALKCQIYNH